MAANAIVIGGGRWGRVTATVLASLYPADRTVALVSNRTFDATTAWAESLNASRGGNAAVEVFSDVPTYPRAKGPTLAIVANAPLDHYQTACALVAQGYHTLVEKPFVLGTNEAEDLIDRAASRSVQLGVGLVFRFATYLHDLRARALGPHPQVSGFRLVWSDPAEEVRYGATKTRDLTTSIIQDVFAHAWSIQQVLFRGQPCTVDNVAIRRGGRTAQLELSVGSTKGVLSLSRAVTQRERKIEISTPTCVAAIDFATEPGTLTVNDRTLAPDNRWRKFPSPLRLEYGCFLTAIAEPERDCDIHARNCLELVSETEKAQAWYQQAQETYLLDALSSLSSDPPPASLLYAMAEHLAPIATRLDQFDIRDDQLVARVVTLLLWRLRCQMRGVGTEERQRAHIHHSSVTDRDQSLVDMLLRESPLVRRILSSIGRGST